MSATGSTNTRRSATETTKGAAAALAGVALLLTAQTTRADALIHWVPFVHLPGVVDLSGPRRDGSLTVTAGGRLFLFSRRVRFAPSRAGRADTPRAPARRRISRSRAAGGCLARTAPFAATTSTRSK